MKNKECLYLEQFHKLQKFLVPSSWFCAFIQMQIISKSTDSPMENLLAPNVTFWSLFTSYPACGNCSNEAFPQKNKSRLIMSSDIVEEYFNVQQIGISCILYTPPSYYWQESVLEPQDVVFVMHQKRILVTLLWTALSTPPMWTTQSCYNHSSS